MNRIVGNVIVVDSAMGNTLILNSAGNVVNLDELQVNAFAFWATDTTGNITITEASTTLDLIYKFDFLAGGGGSMAAANPLYFAKPLRVGNLKVPRLTAGTGFIYLA